MAVASRAATGVLVEVVGQCVRGPDLLRPEPVQAGVDDDSVQPRGDLRIAAEAVGPPERGDQPVLQGVGGIVRVAHGAYGDRPQSVPMPAEELPECVGVTVDVRLEQLGVGAVGHGVLMTGR